MSFLGLKMNRLSPFRKTYSFKERKLLEQLHATLLFRAIPYVELAPIVSRIHTRLYKKDEAVFLQTEPAQAIYILVSGQVSAYVEHRESKETLFRVSEGNSFGHEALFASQDRIFSAKVLSNEALIFAIPKAQLLKIMEDHPSLSARIMYNLAEVYKKYTEQTIRNYCQNTGFFGLDQIKAEI